MGCLSLVSCLLFIISCLLISLPPTCTAHLYPFSAIFSCLSLASLKLLTCLLPPASCFRYNACLIFPGPSPRERLFNFSRPCNLLFRCLFVHRGREWVAWPVDSGNLLANHAHRHRDSLKWRCLSLPARSRVRFSFIGILPGISPCPFIPGSVIGALLGTLIYFSLSEVAIALMLLGSVMLWFSWVPSSKGSRKLAEKIPQPYFWIGIIHTFLSTVSGAGGLLQSLMVNSKLPKESIVATIAGTLLAMSVFKTVGYFLAGFDYLTWLPVILLSWLTGIAGTTVGKYSLNLMPDIFFRRLIKAMVTIFALRLFWRAASTGWAF